MLKPKYLIRLSCDASDIIKSKLFAEDFIIQDMFDTHPSSRCLFFDSEKKRNWALNYLKERGIKGSIDEFRSEDFEKFFL